jgi:hypothetical protein
MAVLGTHTRSKKQRPLHKLLRGRVGNIKVDNFPVCVSRGREKLSLSRLVAKVTLWWRGWAGARRGGSRAWPCQLHQFDGGSLLHSNRPTARPISSTTAMWPKHMGCASARVVNAPPPTNDATTHIHCTSHPPLASTHALQMSGVQATVKDVPADLLIVEYAALLKKNGKVRTRRQTLCTSTHTHTHFSRALERTHHRGVPLEHAKEEWSRRMGAFFR